MSKTSITDIRFICTDGWSHHFMDSPGGQICSKCLEYHDNLLKRYLIVEKLALLGEVRSKLPTVANHRVSEFSDGERHAVHQVRQTIDAIKGEIS